MLHRLLCNCCLMQQLQVSDARRHRRLHVHHHRRLHVRRHLELRARQVRAMLKHEKLLRAKLVRARLLRVKPEHGRLSAEHWCAPLQHDQR